MSRNLTACLTALFLGAWIATAARAQDAAASAPVDIRPAVSRVAPAKPRKPAVVRHAAPEGPLAEKPQPAPAKPKRAVRSAAKKPPAATQAAAKPDAAKAAAAEPVENKAEKPETAEKSAPEKDPTITASTVQKPAASPVIAGDFCANIADLAAETRTRVRAEQIAALESDLRTRIGELEAKRAEVQAWVERQEEIRRRADESVLAILGKMKPESAAAQIALMDDPMAAAVLMKLGAKSASAILNDMGATKAARITESMMAQRVASRDDGVKSAN